MKESLRWRIGLALVVVLVGLIYVLPSFPSVRNSALGNILPSDTINLGLDLQGGIHLTLGVDVAKAVENEMSQTGQELKSLARDKGIVILRPTVKSKNTLEFVLLKAEKQAELEEIIKDTFSNGYAIKSTKTLDNNKIRYTISISNEYRDYIADLAQDQAIKTIRNRIDQFGVTEPDIRRQQDYRIQVQLPGLEDPQRAVELLGRTAHLEFKLVNDEVDPVKVYEDGVTPPDSELLMLQTTLPDGRVGQEPLVVFKDVLLTGEYVSDAGTNFDSMNQPYVSMTFNSQGARKFADITGEYTNKRLAIVLDGKIHSAPVIRERIVGGRASISGSFTTEEAHDLAIVLRAGALPAPINVLEERSVGPSLGQESIDKGVTSALIGLGVVLAFMALYYGFAGVVADTVLMLNLVLIMGALAAFGATLTLPGIAGIILTIGMAVDANVLIFERIREELKTGLTARAAVEEGYSRATLTILDANVTTVIAAIILYQFGTGPIRGFAITLTLGILASMFTAIFVSRIIFDLWLSRKPQAKLSI